MPSDIRQKYHEDVTEAIIKEKGDDPANGGKRNPLKKRRGFTRSTREKE